jgi:Zn-dependent protease
MDSGQYQRVTPTDGAPTEGPNAPMPWSFRVGRLFGVEIRLHYIFILLVMVIGLEAGYDAAKKTGEVWSGVQAGLLAMGMVSTLFAFVLLHELGHSLVAIRHGVRVQDITLLPIGGVSRLSEIPENPNVELKIAIVGPVVNLVIAAVLLPFVLLLLPTKHVLSPEPRFELAWILTALLEMNLILAIFNFLPSFPMDGGRILRAILAKFYPYVVATRIASYVGRFMAVCLFFLSFPLHSVLMGVVAVFVFLAAGQEYLMVRMRHEPRERRDEEPVLLHPAEDRHVIILEPHQPDTRPPHAGKPVANEDKTARAFREMAEELDAIRKRRYLR